MLFITGALIAIQIWLIDIVFTCWRYFRFGILFHPDCLLTQNVTKHSEISMIRYCVVFGLGTRRSIEFL